MNITTIAGAIGAINPLLGAALSIIATIKAIRAAAIAANPGSEANFPSDDELIAKLATEAGLLKLEAGELLTWLRAQEGPTS